MGAEGEEGAMSSRPDDSWNKLLARMKQSAIEECQGVSIMNVRVIMRDGHPIGWSEPHIERYQAPIRTELLEVLLESLT